ncbi:hypothetical protein BGZ59_003928 [Podila verticillata]|nr:hypothetical protein BGZ59_003928 [Podila verticillata]
MDPASLLFIQPDDTITPMHLDPDLFETIGQGVCDRVLNIERPSSSPRQQLPGLEAQLPLHGLKSLAESVHDNSARTKNKAHKSVESRPWIGTAQDWKTLWDKELDQRVLQMDRPNIFDSFHSGHDTPELSSDDSLHNLAPDNNNSEHYEAWNKRTVFGSLSHPAGSTQSEAWDGAASRDSVDLRFELPPLTKRPRDIVDECLLSDGVMGTPSLSKKGKTKVASGSGPSARRLKNPVDTWRAAGMPEQHDTAALEKNQPGQANKSQLSWETCSRNGPVPQPTMPIISPYVTETGTKLFEAVYNKHMDYSFKFKPKPILVSHTELVKDHEETRQDGFYLPPGPDLLSKLYLEIEEQPTADSLWLALLLTLLDQSSKPYRDILGRWIGLSLSDDSEAAMCQLPDLGLPWGATEKQRTRLSMVGSHLQQTLQDLDPFGEFFVQSRHHWSWKGSDNIILADPLDYEAEFQVCKTSMLVR